MIQNQIKAFIRSVMPFVESSAAAAIAHFVYHVSPAHAAQILVAGGVGLSGVLRWLESSFPWVGVFLGWIGIPAYAPSAKKVLTSTVASQQAEINQLKAALQGPQSAPESPVTPAPAADAPQVA